MRKLVKGGNYSRKYGTFFLPVTLIMYTRYQALWAFEEDLPYQKYLQPPIVVRCDIEPLIRSLFTLWKGWENVINFCHSEYILATSAQWVILTLFRSLRDQLKWSEWNKVYSCHPLFWSKYHNSGHSNVWLKQKFLIFLQSIHQADMKKGDP